MTKMDERLLLRIPGHVKRKLEALAVKEGRTVSDIIREAIASLLKRREAKTSK